MDKFSSITAILEFAMQQEQEAIDFYLSLAEKSKRPEIKQIFEEFAMEEVKHKARLKDIYESKIVDFEKGFVNDLKISDYTVKSKAHDNMSYEEALVLAMNKEKAAFKLYTHLAARTNHAELSDLFTSLAIEESKHKLRFEIEYDEFVLRDN